MLHNCCTAMIHVLHSLDRFDIKSLDKGSGEEDEQGILKAVKDGE